MVFSKIINLITTKSNVFKIISLGQKVQDKNNNGKIEENEVTGEKKIIVWYDRNKKKIIYRREL
jgi:predicted regulator of Ras-like GTPase activity (Roadblock/LC7/MglB family)